MSTEQVGRDEKGQFSKGNAGGPGNPFARQVGMLRSALVNAVTKQDIEEIAAMLLKQAKRGDLQAIKLLLAYALGKPAQTVNPDRLDEEEWQQHQRNVVPGEQVGPVLGACTAGLASGLARVAVPKVQDSMKRQLGQAMADSLVPHTADAPPAVSKREPPPSRAANPQAPPRPQPGPGHGPGGGGERPGAPPSHDRPSPNG